MTDEAFGKLGAVLELLPPQFDQRWDLPVLLFYQEALSAIPDGHVASLMTSVATQCKKRPTPAEILEIWRANVAPLCPQHRAFAKLEAPGRSPEDRIRINREGIATLRQAIAEMEAKMPEDQRRKLQAARSKQNAAAMAEEEKAIPEPDEAMLRITRTELMRAGIEAPSDDMVRVRARNRMLQLARSG